MISSILTPMRWYADYNEQNRFSTTCDTCDYELISDKTRLLPFQFYRNCSMSQINKWFLRKSCQDPYKNLLNSNDSLFTIDTGFWSKTNYTIINGKLKGTGNYGVCERNYIFTYGKYYEIRIVVSEVKLTGTYSILATNNSGTLLDIDSPGSYKATFTAGGSDTDFQISNTFSVSTDYIVIDSIEILEYQVFNTLNGDIDLPKTELEIQNLYEQDLISYCGQEFQFQLPCGKYYMIMEDDNSIYYSEVIAIKDFIPSQSPYILLEWKNSCDLSDLKYTIESCDYINRLYVDGVITKPEYLIKEEGEVDGNQNLNITFQKWEKNRSLIIPKAPEFIVDAVTTIRLHDYISFTEALRINQRIVSAPTEIDKTEHDVVYIFNDCAANINLKMLLKNKIVDSTCCSNIPQNDCYECTYTLSTYNSEEDGIFFGTKYDEFGFYKYNGSTWVKTENIGDIICITGDNKKYYVRGDDVYSDLPSISNVTIGGSSFTLEGFNHPAPGNFVQIIVSVASLYTGSYSFTIPIYYTYDELKGGIDIPFSLFSGGVKPISSVVVFSLKGYALNCVYNESEGYEVAVE